MLNSELLAIVLAGGRGTRLNGLTDNKVKPMISFAGSYKIIDFVLSNCQNSGIKQIGITIQYKPISLIKYIGSGSPWGYDICSSLSILPPYCNDETVWYSGTANSIFQNIEFINESNSDNVLILPSDHIYQMNYNELIKFHIDNNSECTIVTTCVEKNDANKLGILEIDADNRVLTFQEKPQKPKSNLASMGIYLFKKSVLLDILTTYCGEKGSKDFGADLIPKIIDTCKIFAYRFDAYWKDVGTIEDYWESNMDFINNPLPLNLNSIKSRNYNLPSSQILNNGVVKNSIVAPGSKIFGKVINSIISPGVIIESDAIVKNSIILNNVIIRSNTRIIKSIIDENVIINNANKSPNPNILDLINQTEQLIN